MMTIVNINKIIPGSFMQRLNEGIKSSDRFCMFCGDEKKDFVSPITGKHTKLQCDCERHYEMLGQFLEDNSAWLINPGNLPSDVINYKSSGKDYSKMQVDVVIKAKANYQMMQDTRNQNEARLRESKNL